MIVKCTDCNAAYSVDDEKVKNKKFGFTCPKCGANVVIDNRTPRAVDFKTQTATIARENITKAETMQKTTSQADFMDFDLAGDDEALLKQEISDKQTSIGIADSDLDKSLLEESSLIDDTTNLDDFAVSTNKKTETKPSLELEEDFNVDEINLEGISLDDVPDIKTSEKTQRIAVDEEDFKPLEEELFDENILSEDLLKENDIQKEYPDKFDEKELSSKTEEILSSSSDESDESITIDLDSLDIQLDESSTQKSTVGSLEDTELEDTEDESITLDLDSLDITLDEAEEFKEGILLKDEDERLTLEDAGISLEQIEAEKHESDLDTLSTDNEEELTLSLNEISPSLEKEIIQDKKESTSTLMSEIEESELPEIDFDKLESDLTDRNIDVPLAITPQAPTKHDTSIADFDKFLDIETENEFEQYKADIERISKETHDTIPYGAINFSIDYSLTHSRLKAFLRLIGLYYILFIPHLIVLCLYSILSSILAFINWLVVLLVGYQMEDFIEIQANTLRHFLSLLASASATTDDLPSFAGKKNLDHAIQLDFIFPSKPSRILAALRLSIIGINILLLPHYLIFLLLTVGATFISFISILTILISKRLPNIFFDFMVRYFRYFSNLFGFHIGLIDRYPSFRFE